MIEILKNSIRASVENNCEPVNIIISGDKDVTIKISDQGKGIKYSDIDNLEDKIQSTHNQLQDICNALSIYIDKKKDSILKISFNEK